MDFLAGMRVFARVVERGNISSAARDLGMGQPAVSERINRLEEHLGEKLLHRTTRTLRPTNIGLLFYERAKKALEAAAHAESVTSRNEAALHGTIRIAAPHSLGEVVLPSVLMRFRKLHPHLKVDLILDDHIVNPISEGVDLSLRLGDRQEPNCVDEEIGFVRRALVASPDYIANYGEPSRPEELIAHPFMRVTNIFADNLVPLRRDGETLEAPINTIWTVSNWRPLHSLLLAGEGIGVLQLPACTKALASGQLKRLLPQFDIPGFRLRLLYGKGEAVSERTRHAVAFLRDALHFLGNEPFEADSTGPNDHAGT
ncbi:MAG: LysR family transcriptional regulator [Rhizobium sp.]